nr:MarR family transcriptional regulator [uncultured Sellimonas sp.]
MEERSVREIPIPLLLNQILHAQTYRIMQYMKDVDLKPGQAGCLFILSKEGKLPQKDIAKRLGVKPPSITALLKKLEARNLIVRTQDDQDQRVSWITLSEEGKCYINRIKDMMKEMDEAMFRDVLPEEKLLFRRILIQIRENLMTKQEMESCSIDFQKKCMADLDDGK